MTAAQTSHEKINHGSVTCYTYVHTHTCVCRKGARRGGEPGVLGARGHAQGPPDAFRTRTRRVTTYHHLSLWDITTFLCVCFITAGPITKLCAWGEEESFVCVCLGFRYYCRTYYNAARRPRRAGLPRPPTWRGSAR